MTSQMALDLAQGAIFTALRVSAPVLLTAIVVGIVVNVVQTVTSIRDMSLTFVPKVAAAAFILGLTMPWGIQTMTLYFEEMYMMFGAVAP